MKCESCFGINYVLDDWLDIFIDVIIFSLRSKVFFMMGFGIRVRIVFIFFISL